MCEEKVTKCWNCGCTNFEDAYCTACGEFQVG